MLIKDKESYRLSIIGAIVAFLSIPFLITIADSIGLKIIIILCIIAIAALFLSKSSGLEIDFSKKRYRNYAMFLGRLKGEWKDLTKYSAIVTLTKTGQKTVSGTLMTSTVKVKQGYYELYLMDENHLKRLFIISSKSSLELNGIIQTLKLKLMLPEEHYNPATKRSEKKIKN